ncbi:hypothetical protein [Catalinimonas alkaloidigena]|nr:hypothetical protein [Catalinimonas alkaloidigena]
MVNVLLNLDYRALYANFSWHVSTANVSAYFNRHLARVFAGDLRQRHGCCRELAEKLFVIAFAQYRQAVFAPGYDGGPIWIYTNNAQLAHACSCTKRTIINQRKRLQECRFILGTRFHGSTHEYELLLNPLILFKAPDEVWKTTWIAEENRYDLHIEKPAQNAPEAVSPAAVVKNFHHKGDRLPDLMSNTEKAVCTTAVVHGEMTPALPGGAATTGGSDEEKQGNAGQTPSKNLEVFDENPTPPPPTGRRGGVATEGGRAGGPRPPAPSVSDKLLMYVEWLWSLAQVVLYPGKGFTTQEHKRAKQVIVRLFEDVPDERLATAYTDYAERIGLVKKWLEKDDERFVTLPWYYFDPGRDRYGFTNTAGWLVKHRQRQREYHKLEVYRQAVREVMKNAGLPPDHPRRRDPNQVFLLAERRVQRLGCKATLNKFYCAIVHKTTS